MSLLRGPLNRRHAGGRRVGLQIGNGRMRNRDQIKTRNTRKIRTQPGVFPAAQVEETPDARLAQVGVYEDGAIAQLRQRYGKIRSRGRLAFAWQGTGNQNDLRRMIGLGEQDRGPQRTKRFRHLRFWQMLSDKLDALVVAVRGNTLEEPLLLGGPV